MASAEILLLALTYFFRAERLERSQREAIVNKEASSPEVELPGRRCREIVP
jgi:hypothetical protein